MSPLKRIKGRYEIKEKLGEGGMGIVYRAYDPAPMDRDVALKTLREAPDRMSLELFYKECAVLKDLTHPNIVKIYDMGEYDDGGQKKPFFVMPLLPGKNLDQLIRSDSHRLSVERVVEIMVQTCRGLQAAHDRKLIHRDLKPSNLFVMEDDSVTIIDFGLAHIIDSRSRSSGFQMGTLLYMAPEQVQYKPVTPQSDIFSLGVVCYETLTRRQPFRGATEAEVVQAIQKFVPPPASEINPAVSEVISRVIHKAMAKQPMHRFDTIREFGETLRKALLGQPIELFDLAKIKPRIDRAAKAFERGDDQFAAEIVAGLEAEGHLDPEITSLRFRIDQFVRQKTIARLMESARARFEQEEDPLALQKIQEILELDPDYSPALAMKAKIEDRRSERQIEKWLSLANEHMRNHSYSHAREAVQNALESRRGDTRAQRLLKEIEKEEKSYLKLRAEKGQQYQAAVHAWKNGEITEALGGMERVLQLDDMAPDTSAPESSGTYRNFYNKIRSEHDAINNGYAEARRYLAELAFAKATKVCQDFLVKYPGQALFQALKLEIEEQEGQRRSAYIAEVDRRLDAEADLDAKLNLLREALQLYPKEGHFEHALKMVSDKRDLVEGIIGKVRLHEKRSQFSEALANLEILRTIYSAYPGLQFEVERLQKRKEKQLRDAAKAGWLEQAEQKLQFGDYADALDLLKKALEGFPGDAELVELQNQALQGSEMAGRAAELLAEGKDLCEHGKIDEGLENLRKARQLDERNQTIRNLLRDVLVEHAHVLLESNWQRALALVNEALELDPNFALAKSLQSQALDRKRDEFVSDCASRARQLQSAGKPEAALDVVMEGVGVYRADPRLVALRNQLESQLGRPPAPAPADPEGIEQLRGLQRRAEKASAEDELQEILARSRAVENSYPNDSEVQSLAREVQRIVRARDNRAAAPPPKPPSSKKPRSRGAPRPGKDWRPVLAGVAEKVRYAATNRVTLWAVGTIAVVALSFAMVRFMRRPKPAVTVTVQIQTDPDGATIRVDGETESISGHQIVLTPGNHRIEAVLPGYETAMNQISVQPGVPAPPLIFNLSPLSQALRITTPDLESAQVVLDNGTVGALVGGSFTLSNLPAGPHVLKISATLPGKEEATINFTTAPESMPAVVPGIEVHELQTVVVSTKPGTAHIASSVVPAAITVDGKDQGQLTADGLDVGNLEPGVHELILGRGKDLRKMSFEVGAAPALDAILFSDRDVGSVLLLTGEDNVQVFLDGRPYQRQTQHGQLRIPNLRTASHTLKVAKDGFVPQPESQQIDIVKGQETRATFVLAPIPKTASLSIDSVPAGAQVSFDSSPMGPAPPEGGKLTRSNITPGSHVITLSVPGFQSKTITKDFAADQTVTLSKADLEMKRLRATLEVEAPSNMTWVISRGGQVFGKHTGPDALELDEGEYTIDVNFQGRTGKTEAISIAAGESKKITLNFAPPSPKGMELWDHLSGWVLHDQQYRYQGSGVILCNAPPGPGTFTFTAQLRHRTLNGGARLKWVVAYRDDKNYILMQLDNKTLSRTVVIDGAKTELPKVNHKIPPGADFVSLRVEISDGSLVHMYNLPNDKAWTALDVWERANSPSLNKDKLRSFIDGKFGFELQGMGDVDISHFEYTHR